MVRILNSLEGWVLNVKLTINYLLFCVGVGLFVFGALIWWVTSSAGLVLDGTDELLFISSRKVLYFVAIGSLALSAFLLGGGEKWTTSKLSCLAWFSCNLLVYEIGSLWSHNANFLNCLGNLNSQIPIAPATLAIAWLIVFPGLFLASVFMLILNWLAGRKKLPAVAREVIAGKPDCLTS
jgi:hypothetical protein